MFSNLHPSVCSTCWSYALIRIDPLHKVGDLGSQHAGFATKAQIIPLTPIYQKIDVSPRWHCWNLIFHSNSMSEIGWCFFLLLLLNDLFATKTEYSWSTQNLFPANFGASQLLLLPKINCMLSCISVDSMTESSRSLRCTMKEVRWTDLIQLFKATSHSIFRYYIVLTRL